MAIQTIASSSTRLGLATRAEVCPPRSVLAARKVVASPHAPALPRSALRRTVTAKQVVAATEANFDEGITGTDDYSPLLAVAGFAAVWFNKLSVDRVKLLQALAVLQLFVTAVNIITNRGVGDKVSNLIGPGVLAASVLSIRHVTYLDVATGLFGYYISHTLEEITGLPYYAYLATLAFALYANYGTLWYVAAFGIAAAGRVYKSSKDNSTVPVIVLPAIAAAAWAIYKEAHFPLALCIFLAQTIWSGFKAIDTLTKRVTD